jgi:hypothetical protein
MSPKTIWLLAVLVVCVYPAAASTYYVGTCKSGSFSTIGAAVTKAPPGSTIMICPGLYSEQLIISKNLTLKGMDSSAADGGNGVQIYPVSSPQTTSSAIFTQYELKGSLAPVVWVTAGTVNIDNVSVETLADSFPLCVGLKTVGFFYASGASGTLNHVGYFGLGNDCQIGIWGENATSARTAFTVENSFSAAGIIAGSLDTLGNTTLMVKIAGNQVLPTAPYGSFGIYVYGVTGTVETNFISGPRVPNGSEPDGGVAIFVDGQPYPTDMTISGNTVQTNNAYLAFEGPNGYGIAANVDGVTVTGNKISGSVYGIDTNCHTGTISGNTISFTEYGILNTPAGSIGVNKFYNTVSKTSPC